MWPSVTLIDTLIWPFKPIVYNSQWNNDDTICSNELFGVRQDLQDIENHSWYGNRICGHLCIQHKFTVLYLTVATKAYTKGFWFNIDSRFKSPKFSDR